MSRWKGLWGSVTGKIAQEKKKAEAKANITIEGLETEEDDIITSVSKIASILMQAADDRSLVEIAFGSRILVYKTRIEFDVDTDPGGAGGTELSSEYLRQGRHMLIGPIDPPEGNDKLMAAGMATLQFAQGTRFNEFHTRYIENRTSQDGEQPLYALEFPQTVFRKQQRRASARFPVSEAAAVILTVERPALITFRALLLDIGTGGISFMQPKDIAPLKSRSDKRADMMSSEMSGDYPENCHLHLKFHWPFEQELEVPGVLIKNKVAMGKTRVHVRFSVESYELSRELGLLVSYVERLELHASAAELRRKGT